MKNGLPVICFFFLVIHAGYAQTVRVLNLKDGLSNNYSQCILQDKSGYIWVGTRDGLNRYNGYEVEVYKDELLSAFIYSLMEDSKGQIWIGTSRGGVSIYDPEKEEFIALLDKGNAFASLRDKDIYTMFEDHRHNVWLGTLQGLAQVNSSRDTVTWYAQSDNNQDFSFTSIYEDDEHTLWLGTNNGLYTLQNDANNFQLVVSEKIPKHFIRDVEPDAKGNMWIATDDHGIYRMTLPDGAISHYSTFTGQDTKNQPAWKLFIDSNGIVWAALINGGIYQFDSSRNSFISYQSKISAAFNSESITDIIEDFNGNLWITSHGDGACYFNPNRYVFEKYLYQNGVVVSSFLEDENGTIWIGTDGDGIKKMTSANEIVNLITVADGLSSNVILDLIEDDNGDMWAATWQGGVNYISKNAKSIRFFNEKNTHAFGLKSADVKSLLKDTLSNIWMVTHGGGVSVYNTKRHSFIDPKSLTSAFRPAAAQWGSDIMQTKNGNVWIASHAGLVKYSGNHITEYFSTQAPFALSSAMVYCLFEDSEGTVWVGTNTSLEKYLPEKDGFENYSTKYGVPGDVKCIVEDNQRHLWISTVNEIISLDLKDNSIGHFDKSYNIQQGQFYECACMHSSTGKLFFGGTEGFNAFHPDSLSKEQFTARVFIINLYLFNKKQKPGAPGSVLDSAMAYKENLSLTYAQNVVSFEFLALNYSSTDKNYYQYKMEGFDSDWSPVATSRMATYTNLDPGRYTFKVRTVSLNGVVLSEAETMIEIIPPFWRTLWFRFIASFVLAFLVIGFLVLRLHTSRKKRLILQQLVDERTKEVRDKNILLEHQKEDLQKKNNALVAQELKIREQTNILAEQKDQLQKTNASLEDLNTTKDRLFSIIAHDLRNPFTSILGFSRLLNTEFDRYADEEKQKLVKSLYHSSASVYSLLENLLVWSKSQQNVLVFSPEKLYFKKIISEQFDLFKDEAEKKNVTLVLKAGSEVSFFADRNMLSIILRNLLSNALKYSPASGKIVVGYERKNSGLEIFVKDDGAGIEKGITLFEVDRHDNRHRDHNHGLGLILCKEFVEKHGGHITAFNNEDKGACFLFTLPLGNAEIAADEIETFETDASHSVRPSPALSHTTPALPVVLLAEDDDQVRWYIRQILFPDFQVIEAVNGADANLLTTTQNPDIIISDLSMPKVDGLAFCKMIKSNSETSHIPFIMLTAERSSEKKVSGFEYGADDYITKPIEPNVLRARLHNMIESRKRLKSIYQKDITALPETFTTNSVDQTFLEKLNGIIEKQISNPELNPDHLAREVSMSRTGLYMKVKALTGESVGIYIRNIRLKESKKLLKERKLNISEVAYAVGFNQLPYFTTCFKEAFGITPSEFISKG